MVFSMPLLFALLTALLKRKKEAGLHDKKQIGQTNEYR
jgi:hypothetical protein